MIPPVATSSEHVVAAKEHNAGKLAGDAAMHPLASEEWLGQCVLAAVADPRAVCQLALINKNFCVASKSNLVWEKFLPPPPHVESLLEECDDKTLQGLASSSKKEFYFRLCRCISLDGGLKKFWLDQRTGGECYMLSARSFSITWSDTPQYWQWKPWPGAWFPEVAYLRAVCWFDIVGRFRQLLKPGSYVVSCRMQMHSTYAWQDCPVMVSVRNLTSAQPPIESRAFFDQPLPISDPPLSSPAIVEPPATPESPETPEASQASVDDSEDPPWVWVECDVGRFTVEGDEVGPVEVEFSIREVEVLYWKSGFVLDGAVIRPAYVVDAKERPTA